MTDRGLDRSANTRPLVSSVYKCGGYNDRRRRLGGEILYNIPCWVILFSAPRAFSSDRWEELKSPSPTTRLASEASPPATGLLHFPILYRLSSLSPSPSARSKRCEDECVCRCRGRGRQSRPPTKVFRPFGHLRHRSSVIGRRAAVQHGASYRIWALPI